MALRRVDLWHVDQQVAGDFGALRVGLVGAHLGRQVQAQHLGLDDDAHVVGVHVDVDEGRVEVPRRLHVEQH
jgi:hypothetical protein